MWSHATICKREKSNIKFLPDKFWPSEINSALLLMDLPITTSFKLGVSSPLQLRPSLLKGITDDSVCPDVQLRKDRSWFSWGLWNFVHLLLLQPGHWYANLYVCSKFWPCRCHLTNVELRQGDFSLNSYEP